MKHQAYLTACLLLASICIVVAQERRLPEPENIGVVYWLDTLNGSLVPLERQTGRIAFNVHLTGPRLALE
jgi:hypothetical protein